MIKSEVSINPEFLGKKVGSKDFDTIIIEEALKKREQLKNLYQKENSNINPLVLIQLPDSKADLSNKKDEVIEILRKEKITEQNQKLAVWLSEEKTDNLLIYKKNDDDTEVLIFKQAIALGGTVPEHQS
jgi:type III restriction enzyme